MSDPTSGIIDNYGIRWNWGTETLEMNTGDETWVPVPGVGATITVNEINSGSSTDGQVITSDGAGSAAWESLPATTPAGSTTEIQFNNAGAFGASSSLKWTTANSGSLVNNGWYTATDTLGFRAGSNNSLAFSFVDADNTFNAIAVGTSGGEGSLVVNDDGSGTLASAILQANSTAKGFLPPRMTSAQRAAISSPAAGLMVYDTDLAKLCVYTTAWEAITSTTII